MVACAIIHVWLGIDGGAGNDRLLNMKKRGSAQRVSYDMLRQLHLDTQHILMYVAKRSHQRPTKARVDPAESVLGRCPNPLSISSIKSEISRNQYATADALMVNQGVKE